MLKIWVMDLKPLDNLNESVLRHLVVGDRILDSLAALCRVQAENVEKSPDIF